jgi:N-acyl-D-amino-acid deacylase
MTLLIKNVRILGGTETFSGAKDVFVNGDKISAIGNFPGKDADTVIEGQGAYLAPGFIDVNTDSDHYFSLFDYPEQDDFLRQGVTTIIGGMCGSSLAPLLYGGLESLQKWGDISKANVNWHSVKEFFDALEKKRIGVNFGTLVGHSTIRRALIGGEIRELTKNELNVFGGTFRKALGEGGMGLSTGLGYVHSYQTPYSELKPLVSITKEKNGVYATHLRRSDGELLESVDETIKLAKDTGAKTIISHFMPILGAEAEYEKGLKKIEDLPKEMDFHFDVYPFGTSVLALYTFLPLWVRSGGREVMLANLKDEWMQPRIVKDMPKMNPWDFTIAQAPGNDYLVGRTLHDLVNIFDMPDYRDALLKLMMVTELRGIVFYKNINVDLITLAIKSPRSMIASNAASFKETAPAKALKPERATSTFTKFLSLVETQNLMPLEEAVKKITFEPARKFGLKGRGVIQENNFADLALFSFKETRNEKAIVMDCEIKCTVVNGGVACKDGQFTGVLSGRTLKSNAG